VFRKLKQTLNYVLDLFDPERYITTYRYIIIHDDGETVKCIPIKVERLKKHEKL